MSRPRPTHRCRGCGSHLHASELAAHHARDVLDRPAPCGPVESLGEPERLLVAFHLGSTQYVVLYASGPQCEQDIEDCDADGLLDDGGEEAESRPDHGLWVWEGWPESTFTRFGEHGDEEYDYTCYDNGSWREPTVDEWAKIVRQEPPWPSRHPRTEGAGAAQPDMQLHLPGSPPEERS